MPDLAYIIRHPIQEARIAMRSRKLDRPKVRRFNRTRLAYYYGTQNVANRLVGYIRNGAGENYSDEIRPDILGEDDRGDLVANIPGTDMWVLFNPWRLSHLRAALTSRRTGLVNFLDLERL